MQARSRWAWVVATCRAVCPPRTVRRDAVWAVHVMSAVILLLPWGVWLMLPFNTFGAGAAYRTMGAIAPEHVWGVCFSTVGTLLYIGAVLGHRRVQIWAASLACLSFALIASMFLWGAPYGAGWLTFCIMAVANYWALRQIVK